MVVLAVVVGLTGIFEGNFGSRPGYSLIPTLVLSRRSYFALGGAGGGGRAAALACADWQHCRCRNDITSLRCFLV